MKSNSLVGVARPSAANLLSWRKECGALPRRRSAGSHIALLFTFIFLHPSFYLRTNAQSYSIDSFTISGGGGTSTGGAYSVTGAIGQPDASSAMTGGKYTVEGGFSIIIAAIQTPGAPLLTVKRVGNTVEISWATTNASGFLLEETGSLAGIINWANVSASATVVNNENVVTVPASTGYRFFRLRKP